MVIYVVQAVAHELCKKYPIVAAHDVFYAQVRIDHQVVVHDFIKQLKAKYGQELLGGFALDLIKNSVDIIKVTFIYPLKSIPFEVICFL